MILALIILRAGAACCFATTILSVLFVLNDTLVLGAPQVGAMSFGIGYLLHHAAAWLEKNHGA